jgi:hypothetical protein
VTGTVPLVAVGTLVLVCGVALALALRGWRARARRQAGVPAPARPAGGPGPDAVPGVYVSTTRAGDWLDRVVVHGLGVRSPVLVDVGPDGVAMHRTGARPVQVPAADLVGVRRERGMAGKYVDAEGLVVITWRLGPETLDTGVRTRTAQDGVRLVAALERLLAGSAR